MERLHKSCRRLIWLNPLLRYGGLRAQIAWACEAILPHVDEFRPVHNLESLGRAGRRLRRHRAPLDKRLAGWSRPNGARSRP